MRPLALYPDPSLRVRCAPVSDAASASLVVADVLATLASHDGLGLAAPQVHSSLRVFGLRVPAAWTERDARRVSGAVRRQLASRAPAYVACVNPEILHRSSETVLGVEGCLSLPDAPALVRRASRLVVRYTDASGSVVEQELTGLPATVFQHEMDHLDGVLICDREVKALLRDTREDAIAAASEAFTLGLAKYYAVLQ